MVRRELDAHLGVLHGEVAELATTPFQPRRGLTRCAQLTAISTARHQPGAVDARSASSPDAISGDLTRLVDLLRTQPCLTVPARQTVVRAETLLNGVQPGGIRLQDVNTRGLTGDVLQECPPRRRSLGR